MNGTSVRYRTLLFACLLLSSTSVLLAQQPKRIQLLHAKSLEGGIYNGDEIRKLRGNVAFKHKGAVMHCDSAYQYANRNALHAFSNVRIEQGDSLTLTGDTLYYNGNTRMARVRGDVTLKDGQTTLETTHLDYDMPAQTGYYYNGGTIEDGENTLTSQSGTYHANSKMFAFHKNVYLDNPDYDLYSDTLLYNSGSKVAFFEAPTKIISESGTLHARKGTYQTLNKISRFRNKAKIETPKYLLSADSLYYEEQTEYGVGHRNVFIKLKEDDVIIQGEHGYHIGAKGRSRVYDRALMLKKFETDTLFLTADTLKAINDTLAGERKLLAYNNVRMYRSQTRGKCDSLVYNMKDSTIYMYRDPLLWHHKRQIEADSINMELANNELKRMNTHINSFIITEDTMQNYNQVKGRDMVAHFKDNEIRSIDVMGNAESIYHALEGDSVYMGMNKAFCSNMRVDFKNSKLENIVFIKEPEADFIPPHEIEAPERRLKDFRWRIKERPEREDVVIRKIRIPAFPATEKIKTKAEAP